MRGASLRDSRDFRGKRRRSKAEVLSRTQGAWNGEQYQTELFELSLGVEDEGNGGFSFTERVYTGSMALFLLVEHHQRCFVSVDVIADADSAAEITVRART